VERGDVLSDSVDAQCRADGRASCAGRAAGDFLTVLGELGAFPAVPWQREMGNGNCRSWPPRGLMADVRAGVGREETAKRGDSRRTRSTARWLRERGLAENDLLDGSPPRRLAVEQGVSWTKLLADRDLVFHGLADPPGDRGWSGAVQAVSKTLPGSLRLRPRPDSLREVGKLD